VIANDPIPAAIPDIRTLVIANDLSLGTRCEHRQSRAAARRRSEQTCCFVCE
jgi:hypothetical protein